jgi:class 3 adenylate cyclase
MGKIGAELLSKHLNEYFGMVIEQIHEHGGDLIKIAGDALFVVFQTRSEDDNSIAKATLRASQCALHLKNILSTFRPVEGLTLHLRFSIAVGCIYGIHVGSVNRWEFLIIGDPLRQVKEMEESSGKQLGKLLLSLEAWSLVSKYCTGVPLDRAVLLDSINKEYQLKPLPLVDSSGNLLNIEEQLQVS